jgi:AcrR family transcriptional regulator
MRRSNFTDEEILARARSVFLERGYAARTKQIASAVGLTWAAIANRFGDKRSLFLRAMAGPERGEERDFERAGSMDLPGLLERVRTDLWTRWPLRLQYRLAPVASGPDDEAEELVSKLAGDFEARAHRGSLRTDMSPEMLTRAAVAMLTGDVAQRFVARERTLAADPTFIGAVVSLLSAH